MSQTWQKVTPLTPGMVLKLSLVKETNIIIVNDESKDIIALEKEFDFLYNEALKLQDNPDNPTYVNIKNKLDVNLDKREKLLRG